jgi:hypothetical protein
VSGVVSEVVKVKRSLVSEDKVSVRTYESNGSRQAYDSDIELNGRKLSGSVFLPEYMTSEHLKGLMDRIYSKVKALLYVEDPRAADALADEIARDAANLIALARALAHIVKGREAH